MTDVLPSDEPHPGSHPEGTKRAEHVRNASPIRAHFEEKQQQPTPPKSPTEPNDQKSSPTDPPSKSSQLVELPTKDLENGTNKASADEAGAVENAKIDGEDDTKEYTEESGKSKSDAKGEDGEEKPESPEVALKKMQERMNYLEKELKDYGIILDSDDKAKSETDEKREKKDKRLPAIPKLQHMEWEEFKHKYANEEEFYAIEVLVGEARYYHQRVEDLKKIKKTQAKTPRAQAEFTEKKSDTLSTDAKPPKELPERIRINSKPILSILGQIGSEEEWGTEPTVVLRPFKPLIFFQRQIREAFEKLKDRWGEAEKKADAEKAFKAAEDEKARRDSASDRAIKDKNEKSEEHQNAASAEESEKEPASESNIKADEVPDAEGENSSPSQSKEGPTTNGLADSPSVTTNTKEASAESPLDVDRKDAVSATATAADVPKFGTEKDDSNKASESQPTDKVEAVTEVQKTQIVDGNKSSNGVQPEGESKPQDETQAKDNEQSEEEQEDLTDSVEALRDLRCLIEFIDNELQPVVDRLSSETCQKAYFSELWHLFKPGDLIYSPLGNKTESEVAVELIDKTYPKKPNDRIQDVWKIMSTADGRANLRAKHDSDSVTVGDNTRVNSFIVLASYIDYNGSKFGALTYQHNIKAYKGERDITSLIYYPLKYAPNRDELKSRWLKRGRVFKDFMTPKHRYFFGRSLTSRPAGSRAPEDDFPKHAETIDSQVVVDFTEGLAANPGWGPNFAVNTMMETLYREFNEDYPVTVWKDRSRREVEDQKTERHFLDLRVDEKMMELHREKDPLTKELPDPIVADDGQLDEESLMLLPNRVFAFVMKNRKFAILTVDGMRDIKPYRDGFKDLKLPGKHKNMVSSLVHNHFRNKKADLNDREASHDSDIVRGKGKGLIVLLHGAPGVGKTSTAETVAEAYRKPLFPITCGDLGLTAAEVEAELEDKFHLAELWDCVLLLDEADVFLAQRTRTDVKRNSLVSVFLRVLEYFTGILFLTTNRVGSFDEAFKSRIHISLYYPPLTWNQTQAIWEMNMSKLRDKKRRRKEPFKADEERLYRFAHQHFSENHPKGTHWNGRQIRNAFQTATALSEFEAHEAVQKRRNNAGLDTELTPFEPELRVDHFETVALASSEFDDYLYKVRGKTDSGRALFDQERADQFQSAQKPYPRKAQQPAQAYQGMPPPPLMQQGAPAMPAPQAQRSARSQRRLSRQQQPYVENRPQQYMSPSLHDVLSEEEEDPNYA